MGGPTGMIPVASASPPMMPSGGPNPTSSSKAGSSGMVGVPSSGPTIAKHDSSIPAIKQAAQSGPYPTPIGGYAGSNMVR